jgi:hypothetical protein
VFLTGAQPLSSGQIGAAIRIGQTPRRNENCLPGLPADDADLDLAVPGTAVFEGVLWCLAYCDSSLTLDLANPRQ